MSFKLPVLFFQTSSMSLMLQRNLVTRNTTPTSMRIIDLPKHISSLLDSSCDNPHAAHLMQQSCVSQEILPYSWAELKADEFRH